MLCSGILDNISKSLYSQCSWELGESSRRSKEKPSPVKGDNLTNMPQYMETVLDMV